MKTLRDIVLILLISAVSVIADTTRVFVGWDGSRYHPPNSGHNIGLALSGGGARGLAQVGVIKALEENGLRINAIAGTSMGGIIGGLYASGYSADSLEKIILSINFPSLFSDRPPRNALFLTQRPEKERYLLAIRFEGLKPFIPQGLTAGQKLTDLISRLTLKADYMSGGSFSALPIPYRSVTTDVVSGKEVVLSDGSLADAMRATMAFPLAFTGVDRGDMLLMDGGMVNPIPVDVVRGMDKSLGLVAAVNTTSELLPKNKIDNPIDIANQVTSIMTLEKKEAGLQEADVVITPDIPEFVSTDFSDADSIIQRGYEAGERSIPEIMRKLDPAGRGDTVYLADVSFTSLPHELDTAALPIPHPGPVRLSDMAQIASNLYLSGSLFSVAMNVIAMPNSMDGYKVINLEIEMISRPQFDDLRFTVQGNTIYGDSSIVACLEDDRPRLSSEVIVLFCDSLKSCYRSKGYDMAHVRQMSYIPAEHRVDIIIDEVPVERIEVKGNLRTKNWLVKSNFPPKQGRPLSSKEVSKGIANIYNTGLFERVTMGIQRAAKGAILRIYVEERKYTQARFGWHWDDEYKSEEFAEILDDNLFGTGQEYLMHARYSPRRQRYEISLKADRFFSTYLTYRLRGYYGIVERKLYDNRGETFASIRENRTGWGFELGQQIARFGTVTTGIRWDQVENKFKPSGTKDKIRLRTIGMRSLVESMNRTSFPTSGKKHFFYIEYAADILGGQTRYTKVFSSIESYFPLGSRLNFHPKISVGWSETDYMIPVSEKYYIGGEYSFSGYETDELAGDKMVLGNLELRCRLPYKFYLTGRYDTGEVYKSIDQIKLRNLRHGLGVSLAYDSPIGPVDFGYGKAGHHPDRWYVNIGLAF